MLFFFTWYYYALMMCAPFSCAPTYPREHCPYSCRRFGIVISVLPYSCACFILVFSALFLYMRAFPHILWGVDFIHARVSLLRVDSSTRHYNHWRGVLVLCAILIIYTSSIFKCALRCPASSLLHAITIISVISLHISHHINVILALLPPVT